MSQFYMLLLDSIPFTYQSVYHALSHFMPYYVVSFITIELAYNFFIARNLFVSETKVNILSGLVVIISNAILQAVLLGGIYPAIYSHRLFDLGHGMLVFIYGFFLYTFLQYVSHYLSHKIRFFWCLHEVHHSATQMNSTTGIRNPIFDIMSTDALYFLIPWLGIPPIMFLTIYLTSKIWGNFIHINENIVSEIPYINQFLVDPSTHHIHHAKNIIYLDKNFCELTPLFDKLFGTYKSKTEIPEFGSSGHENPSGFWDVQLFEFRKLKKDIQHATTLQEKCLYLIMPPGWAPNGLGMTTKQKQRQIK